jgi:hypothetical protein
MKKSDLEIVKRIASGIKADKTDVVKSIAEGFKTPDKFSFGGFNAKSYVPEIYVGKESGKADYYIFVPKYSKKMITEEFGKWIFFNIEAKKMNGVFYLMVRKDDMETVTNLITSKQITAQTIEY